ncbi:hypothetical protein CMPELA_11585 [Cupriavidus necator]
MAGLYDSLGNPAHWVAATPGTNVFGRSNFTIHGGSYPGSAGCIDFTSSMNSFAKEFLYYAKDMELEVRY